MATAFFWAAVAAASLSRHRLPRRSGRLSGVGAVVLNASGGPAGRGRRVRRGKTMKEALANLKDRREAARVQLKTLGAARTR